MNREPRPTAVSRDRKPAAIGRAERKPSAEPRRDLAPVDHIPPGPDVIRPAVLILEVVGVLPDVESQDRLLAFHERVVLVRRARDRKLAAVRDEPGPARSEARRR